MKLSLNALTSVGVPAEMLSWFGSQYENAGVEYQDVLDTLAHADLPDLAIVLMDCLGADDSAQLEVDTAYDAPGLVKHIFAAGDLTIRGDCNLGGWIHAGSHIRSNAGIRAGCGVVSGASIRVAHDIRSGGPVCSGGRIDVEGNIFAKGHIHSGYAITVRESIQAGADVGVGQKAQCVLAALATIYDSDDCPAEPITNAVSDLLEACCGQGNPFEAFIDGGLSSSLKAGRNIDVGADLSCVDAIYSGGTLRVGGSVLSQGEIIASQDVFIENAMTATGLTAKGHVRIDGNLIVQRSVATQGDLFVGGDIVLDDSRGSVINVGGVLRTDGCIKCAGSVTAVVITAGRNVSAGSLRTIGDLTVGGEICVRRHVVCSLGSVSAEGSIFAGGSIQAGRSVRSAGEVVHGDGYGVYAGTVTHRSVVSTDYRAAPKEVSGIAGVGAEDVA